VRKINVTVNTNAKDNSVIRKEEDIYKVNVSISPESGKANRKVLELLAKFLQLKKSQLIILKGHKNKNKIIEISE